MVGGLDEEVAELNRRIWLPFLATASMSVRLDLRPPQGLILFGPPGCGKSLLAVALAKCLTLRAPKIVRGPELKSSAWGSDEENIRHLFEENAHSRREPHAKSMKVIILDEAESILSARTADEGGSYKHYNTQVTQFLACMDGAHARLKERQEGQPDPPRLLIALTNQLELIDSALLRPGVCV